MKRPLSIALVLAPLAVIAAVQAAPDQDQPREYTAAQIEAGKRAFADVAKVLQSPRCRNCHPIGDAPLQGDPGRRHAMNISRASVEAGVPCRACHQDHNSEAVGVAGGPPGAPNWGLPPKEFPMVFQGKSPTALCQQLRDPARNKQRSLDDLLEHVSHDPLVLWGWSPGGTRTLPPLTHTQFVAAFTTWVASGGACP